MFFITRKTKALKQITATITPSPIAIVLVHLSSSVVKNSTAKQLKKLQRKQEQKFKIGHLVTAHWTYSDYMDNEQAFSHRAEIVDIGRDHYIVKITKQITDHHKVLIYPKDWMVYVPKADNPLWSIHNRIEK